MSLRDQYDICGHVKKASQGRGRARHAQLWAKLVDPGDEKGDAKRAAHHCVLVVHTLSETKCEIANRLCDTLHLDALVVGEGMVLGGDTGVIDDGARVGGETGHGTPEMRVDLHDFLY